MPWWVLRSFTGLIWWRIIEEAPALSTWLEPVFWEMTLNSGSPASFLSLDLLVKKLPQVIWPLEVSGSQNLIHSRISFRELPKTQMAGPYPWVSHTVCRRWALKICTFWTDSQLIVMVLGLRTTFWDQVCWGYCLLYNHDDFNRDWPSSQGQNIQLVLKWLRLYSLKANT